LEKSLNINIDNKGRKWQQTSIQAFIAQLQPRDWNLEFKDPEKFNDRWNLVKWFEWPPDIFALTSLILNNTGAYRHVASPPPGEQWPKGQWPEEARDLANKWRNWIVTENVKEHPLQKYIETIREYAPDTTLDQLYDCALNPGKWELCRALLELHAIADEAMRGVGSIFAPFVSLSSLEIDISSSNDAQPSLPDKLNAFYLQANFLLTLRGSLSRIPKHRGIVLPKSRTPQVGLTLRSFSLHLTFHPSEVDIAWRSFPWFNFDENTLNIMIVPWPYEVPAISFKPVPHPKTRAHLGSVRFFHYEHHSDVPLDCEKIVAQIKTAQSEVNRVHLLIFPEMALRKNDLKDLKDSLETYLPPHKMPMIITGISAKLKKDNEENAGYNRVVLSVYYAEKWHDVVQDKHHPWLIDPQQLQRYNLGGVLAGSRNWWEAIHIPRRRLSFLAANPWLTICPLICEDLARLEPVSDLIRGVGPTLLTALLLDGPQIRERWSARYASVFADDPGTSVLTLTSLGMCIRSNRVAARDHGGKISPNDLSHHVASWKDQNKGWLSIQADQECKNVIFTVSANWIKEFTSDGRVERDKSAIFTYQGIHTPKYDSKTNFKPTEQGNESLQFEELRDSNLNQNSSSQNNDNTFEKDEKNKRLSILDMCELTLFTFYVDALIDTKINPRELQRWVECAVGAVKFDPKQDIELKKLSQFGEDLIFYAEQSIKMRDLVPKTIPTPHFLYAIDKITEFVEQFSTSSYEKTPGKKHEEKLLSYWKEMIKKAEETIEEIVSKFQLIEKRGESTELKAFIAQIEKEVEKFTIKSRHAIANRSEKEPPQFRRHEAGRILLSTPLSIFWAIHTRLTIRRRQGTLTTDHAQILEEIEKKLTDCTYHKAYLEWKKWCKTQNNTKLIKT